MKQPLITITFDVEAGRFEPDGERNCKYCCTFDSAKEAAEVFQHVNDYPYAELDLVITVDGATSRINLFGGDDPNLRLRMDIAHLWMNATGNSFSKVATPVDEQIDDIHSVIYDQKHQLYNLHNKVRVQQRVIDQLNKELGHV